MIHQLNFASSVQDKGKKPVLEEEAPSSPINSSRTRMAVEASFRRTPAWLVRSREQNSNWLPVFGSYQGN